MGLETYHQKRDFTKTPEPRGKLSKADRQRFVVQEHHASVLHFDFRLEMGGVLKSWSVPKGPSLDAAVKRLAIATEDHPVEYLDFQGHIPEGNYGAGEHMIWDGGKYELVSGDDPLAALENGKLKIRLHGEKLTGDFNLFRLGKGNRQWMLVKSKDDSARANWKLKMLLPEGKSVPKASKKRATKKPKSEQPKKGNVSLKVGRTTVALTNLTKLYWPKDGITKGDLVEYYLTVAEHINPYLKDRPLIMKRFPNGVESGSFHQHNVEDPPSYVRTKSLIAVEGHTVDYIVGGDIPSLLYMTNLGAIERHPWHSRARNLNHADWIVFDLDPSDVKWKDVCRVAIAVREVLANIGLDSCAKTSGSRGMHIYVPIKPKYPYDEVLQFSARVARIVVSRHPDIATVERALKKRGVGKIYVDFMQNARGKSVVAPYSVRPRAGATVSAPLEWSEVEKAKVEIGDFTIKTMPRRLDRKGDLFEAVLNNKQSLDRAIKDLSESE